MNSIKRPGGEDSVEMECREEMTSKHLVLTNEAERTGWAGIPGRGPACTWVVGKAWKISYGRQ